MARFPLLLGGPLDRGRVYSVAQVQAGLVDQPEAWVGRTVRVRGIAALCLSRQIFRVVPSSAVTGRRTW
jgi:hypothetical protein